MKEIDKKLEEVFRDFFELDWFDFEKTTKQIKQVFIDELKKKIKKYCEGCEHQEAMKKYGKGMYHCRDCKNEGLTDVYNSALKEIKDKLT